MGYILAVTVFLVLSVIGLGLYYIKRGVAGKNAKKILGINIMSIFGLLIVATAMILANNAYAEGASAQAAGSVNGLGLLAAALSTGLATIGAGIAVAVSSSAALGAISEDSSLLGKTLIFVGLAEGIAIYGLIVSILILGRL
ncbi:MAG: ATP synthase subunit C [Clostridia bacterium]|nr:ATP synthase subunit C [Clostridia bacterium]